MSRKMSQKLSRINRSVLAVGLLAAGLSLQALAQSVPFPTYQVGPQTNGTFVASDGTIIAPTGKQVNLGIRVRAKAIALNPTGNHTAAVMVMGTSGSNGKAVEVFNTETGAILQTFEPSGDPDGSSTGIAYTPNGKYLLVSQDGENGPTSVVGIASVNATTGLLSNYAQVKVAMDVDATGRLTNVTCFPNSPGGTSGSFLIPCGYPVSIFSDDTFTSYPMGIAVSPDATTAYVVLDNNDTLTKIDLTATTPVEGAEIRVGNIPHSVVISPDGKTAYVSNEGGRIATERDFQGYSNGTPVVAAFPTGATATGTVSVVDLASFKVAGSIETGLHPTGMALWGKRLLVANTYSDNLSVIDMSTNKEERKINLGLPIGVPGEGRSAYGAGPNSIAVDAKNNIAYVALYNANAIAVVDLNHWGWNPVKGLIAVAYAPASVVLDTVDNVLLVANDKGWGTTGNPNPFAGTVPDAPLTPNSETTEFGVTGLETHQDLGTVSIVPVPTSSDLWSLTQQVFQNNHWDLAENIFSAAGGDRRARPLAIPNRIGDPSKIKHVFLIIRENRTYDQMLGDVAAGNGDASLAVFGDNATSGPVSPNAHALVQRFPLFDNYYNPSRQSADGHNWITQAMAPYSDDIQSPDWLRNYPSNGGEALAYQKKGHLWDVAAKQGVSFKNYGEYIEYNSFNPPQGCTPTNETQANSFNGPGKAVALPFIVSDSCEPLWIDFYNDTLAYESGAEKQLYNYNTVASHSPLPNLINNTVPNYPQFDLGIPDQFRFDIWNEDFKRDVAADAVPQLEMMWISSDHTGGPPTAQAMQADNDLALGRFVDAISHSSIWKDSAIFVTEDDAQTGVDHVDGHRSPGYVISPFVLQNGITDSTFYTQVNMTRTIEQILGMTPMNQNDLVASPMRTAFVDDPPAENFKPWTHVPNGIALDTGVSETPTQTAIPAPIASVKIKPQTIVAESPAIKALRTGWMKKKTEIFAGKYQKPDSEDPNTVNHLIWYEATNFTRPFPGEKKVLPASTFNRKAPAASADLDD